MNEIEKKYNQKFMSNLTNELRMKALFKLFIKNQMYKKKCSHTISSIYETHNVKFKDEGTLLMSLRRDLL